VFPRGTQGSFCEVHDILARAISRNHRFTEGHTRNLTDQSFIVGEGEMKEYLLQGRKLFLLFLGNAIDGYLQSHCIRTERIRRASEHVSWELIEEQEKGKSSLGLLGPGGKL
jgi:hypothetical protein